MSGRHRKPSNTGRTVAKFALTGKPEREVRGLGVIAPVRLQRAFTPEG